MLRRIRPYIEDFEPRYDPTVVPRDQPSTPTNPASDGLNSDPRPPKNGYYSIADFHALYLSGDITPTAVARAILPLIRRDTTPPGEHSLAWFDTKVDAVLRAAEESTKRYREKRPLGPLDGVPTAVKDEYSVDGYRTCLGSKNDYTDEAKDGDNLVASWTVQKLEEAGAVILGKLSMHEFGLGMLLSLLFLFLFCRFCRFCQLYLRAVWKTGNHTRPRTTTTTTRDERESKLTHSPTRYLGKQPQLRHAAKSIQFPILHGWKFVGQRLCRELWPRPLCTGQRWRW